MLINRKWTTIIESVIVMMIVTIWILWTYDIYSRSKKMSNSSTNKIQAISLAREGIESMINIRDTNWILYSANTNNCWNTYNYNWSCVTNDDINIPTWSYIIYKNNLDRWILYQKPTWWFWSWTYRDNFKVMMDNNWFYTQSWGTIETKPLFTREIKITYPIDSWIPPQKMKVESIVRWTDSSKNSWNFEVKLETLLTNWKK